jgi:DNA-binding response OmpR family regulator
VEDDESLGFLLQDNLEAAGYLVTLASDGETGLQAFRKEKFDLCLLDVMLPKKDGFALAEDIRLQDGRVPLLFLTAKSLPEDRIKGFQIGADDYLTKPFSMEELTWRVRAILRRVYEQPMQLPEGHLLRFGGSRLDYPNLLLWVGASSRTLTQKEADLLRMLAQYPNQVLTRDHLLKTIWEDNGYFVARSMDVFISRLRKYLRSDERLRIVNIHGVGYKLATSPPVPLQ